MFGNGEAESGAADLAGTSDIHAIETLENARLIGLGNADAGVRDAGGPPRYPATGPANSRKCEGLFRRRDAERFPRSFPQNEGRPGAEPQAQAGRHPFWKA